MSDWNTKIIEEFRAGDGKGGDRDRIFAEQARRYPGFAEYQAKTSRVIPVVEIRRA
jgi:hypothetical protein